MDAPTLAKLTEIRESLEEALKGCPAGQHVCPESGECVPIGSGGAKGPRKFGRKRAGLGEGKKRKLTVPEKHQLRIAKQTLKMPGAMGGVMGGMSKKQAREIIKKLGEALEETSDKALLAKVDDEWGIGSVGKAKTLFVHGKSPHRVAVKKHEGKYYAVGEDGETRRERTLKAIKKWMKDSYGYKEKDIGEALEPREATRARMKAIAMRQKAKGKVEPREATRERMKAIAARQKAKSKLKPGEKMVFGKVVKAGARR